MWEQAARSTVDRAHAVTQRQPIGGDDGDAVIMDEGGGDDERVKDLVTLELQNKKTPFRQYQFSVVRSLGIRCKKNHPLEKKSKVC